MMIRKTAIALLAALSVSISVPLLAGAAEQPYVGSKPQSRAKAQAAEAIAEQKAAKQPVVIKRTETTPKVTVAKKSEIKEEVKAPEVKADVAKNTDKADKKIKEKKKTKAKEKKSKEKKEKTTSKKSTNNNAWRIKVAQQNLQELGYLNERPSGKLTDATKAALATFQKRQKLKETGELDDATYQKLTWESFKKTGISHVEAKDVLKEASKHKGVPYVFGGASPKGFDCSGYVQYVFGKLNAKMPRVADEQVLKGVFVTKKQLRPGDLVFFTTYAPGASHVGIYAGNNQFWNSTSSRGVMLSSLNEDYWRTRYYGARRVLVSNGEAK